MDTSTVLPMLDETTLATTRYLQALTRLDDTSARAPSVLPGWTRAHVVAHVSRNADAFERVVTQAAAGEAASMYDAPSVREHDIARTVEGLDLDGLRRDAQRSAERLARAWRLCDADPDASYSRIAGEGPTFPLPTVGWRRLAEVEIHHADLDLGYLPADWPPDFSRTLVGRRQQELADLPHGSPSMVLSSTDVDGLWKLGDGPGPEIHGTVGDLAWWLVGRGGGQGLTSSSGELPVLGRWR